METTLHVPAQFVKHFRRAVLEEVKATGGSIGTDEVANDRYIEEGPGEQGAVEYHNTARLCMADLALLDQVGNDPEGAEVTGGPDTLSHVCEAMARVLAPTLANEVATSPLDESGAAPAEELLGAITWAVGQGKRLHAEWEAEWHRTHDAETGKRISE